MWARRRLLAAFPRRRWMRLRAAVADLEQLYAASGAGKLSDAFFPTPELTAADLQQIATKLATEPSPQLSWAQVAEQPSPELRLPSSQLSSISSTALPHASISQLSEQPSPASELPSSHDSPNTSVLIIST